MPSWRSLQEEKCAVGQRYLAAYDKMDPSHWEADRDTLKKNLEQREKDELIAIIQHKLRQDPELRWLLMPKAQSGVRVPGNKGTVYFY
jgi:hypothetical protein